MWRVTPPGYVHEYGDTNAIRIVRILSPRPPVPKGSDVKIRCTRGPVGAYGSSASRGSPRM